MEQIVVKLRQEQMQMQEAIFKCPPADYSSFCKLMGKWQGLQLALDIFSEVLNGRRTNEDD